MRQTLVTAPGGGGVGLTVTRPGGVVTSLPGWPGLDYFKCEDWCMAGAVPSAGAGAGELNWWKSGPGGFSGGYPALADQEVGHPGVRDFVTGAASGQQSEIQVTAASGTLTRSDRFDSIWVVKPVVLDGNAEVRFGFANDIGQNPPNNGFYFEKLFADLNFFAVTRTGGATQTRVDTGIVAATVQWLVARLAWVSATELGWAITSGATLPALAGITTNLPQALKEFRPGARISNNAAAVKSMLVDYTDLAVFATGR